MSKLVCGIGVCDKGQYLSRIKCQRTKEYALWAAMLNRCKPGGPNAYLGCTVHPDFVRFQDFARWCHKQIGFRNDGWELDKDILVKDNRVYGPDTCCFVPKSINQLLTHRQSSRGAYPTGVSFDITRNLFQSKIKIDGHTKSLGRFNTPEQAEAVYKNAKYDEIRRLANLWKPKIGHRVYFALMQYQL